jgi:hypothetical protein
VIRERFAARLMKALDEAGTHRVSRETWET